MIIGHRDDDTATQRRAKTFHNVQCSKNKEAYRKYYLVGQK